MFVFLAGALRLRLLSGTLVLLFMLSRWAAHSPPKPQCVFHYLPEGQINPHTEFLALYTFEDRPTYGFPLPHVSTSWYRLGPF